MMRRRQEPNVMKKGREEIDGGEVTGQSLRANYRRERVGKTWISGKGKGDASIFGKETLQ
jgi:hypothetical protein